jgi:hypothetical protein
LVGVDHHQRVLVDARRHVGLDEIILAKMLSTAYTARTGCTMRKSPRQQRYSYSWTTLLLPLKQEEFPLRYNKKG